MDENNESINHFMAVNAALKCDNCSSWIHNELENEEISPLKNILQDTQLPIWEALTFIYGVSWASIQNFKSEKRTQILKTPDDIRFCSNCATLLNNNYNSHLQFEHSSDTSSVVQLLKEFRDYYQIHSSDKQINVQLISNDLVEKDIKVDLFEDFILKDFEEDPFHSEERVEIKYEPPSTSDENFSNRNTSCISAEEIHSPSLRISSLRPRRQLVIKTEKLSAEEILQFTNKTGRKSNRTTRTIPSKPKKTNTIKHRGKKQRVENRRKLNEKSTADDKICNEQSVRNKSKLKEESVPEEKILKGAQNLKTGRKKARTKAKTLTGINPILPFDEKVKLIMEKYKDTSKLIKVKLNGSVICTVCGKGFKTFDYLKRRHWPVHQETNTNIRICDICGKSLHRLSLKQHKLRAHATEEEKKQNKIKCNLCEEMVYPFVMAWHIKVRHSNIRPEPAKCNLCGKIYSCKTALKTHTESHHGDGSNTKKCDLCDKVVTIKHLKHHLKNFHSGIERERTFCCDLCPKKFMSKGDVRIHRLTHSDLREHICEECGKTFKSRKQFNNHLKCHREIAEKGEWAFACSLCEGRTFKHSIGLKKHMRHFHRASKRKLYECSYCSKQLTSGTSWRAHEKRHKENPGFVPRPEKQFPGIVTGQISSDRKPTVETPHKPLSSSAEIEGNPTINCTDYI